MRQLPHDIAAEPIEGYRIFRLNTRKGLLQSVAMQQIWLPGQPMQSDCNRSPHGGVHDPHENCTCGIHAARSRNMLSMCYPGLAKQLLAAQGDASSEHFLFFNPRERERTGFLSARVRLWGHVIQHAHGYRASWGEIIPQTLQWWPRRHYKHNNKLLLHLREKYDVPSTYQEVEHG